MSLLSRVLLAAIQDHMTPKVYARAEDLLASHAIQRITQCRQSLEAQVRGGQLYTVKFLLDDTGFPAAVACDCEYSFSGWRKHQGAVAIELPIAASGQ